MGKKIYESDVPDVPTNFWYGSEREDAGESLPLIQMHGEQSYRRGYYQAVYVVLEYLRAGHSPERIKRFLEGPLYKWRYDTAVDTMKWAPEIAHPSRTPPGTASPA